MAREMLMENSSKTEEDNVSRQYHLETNTSIINDLFILF